jgi:ribosome-dependent ATPase
MNGFLAILLKEFSHIRRERGTLIFALFIPVLQLTLFGYAIDTKIEHVRTAVLNLDGRRESLLVIEAFENSRTFRVVEHIRDHESLAHAITSGRAKVGLVIPPDYTDHLVRGQQAMLQVLIDGGDSQVAQSALNVASRLGIAASIQIAKPYAEALQVAAARDPSGALALPVDMRPRLLFNPDLQSERFFVPALVGIILQNVTIFLTAFAIVRERELGTLEQLFVTPVGRLGLMLGKLVPYAMLGFLETLIVLLAMVFAFNVPIVGNLFLLLSVSVLFIVAALGLGLLISTVARTQLEAMQNAFFILLPSILLSGFMFPRDGMPLPIYLLSFAIPVTHYLEMLRGIILRGADLSDLLPQIYWLTGCCVVILTLSVTRFRKQLD